MHSLKRVSTNVIHGGIHHRAKMRKICVVAITIIRDMQNEKVEKRKQACSRSGNDISETVRATIGAQCDSTLGPAPSPHWVTKLPL